MEGWLVCRSISDLDLCFNSKFAIPYAACKLRVISCRDRQQFERCPRTLSGIARRK
jgi:hypothetical protein